MEFSDMFDFFINYKQTYDLYLIFVENLSKIDI